MTNLHDQMRQDAGLSVNEAGIQELSKLAEQQLALEERLLQIAEEAKTLGTQLKTVSEDRIPSLMTQLGVSEFKLVNGAKVTVKPYYSASIPKEVEPRTKAFDWLKQNGHDDIIKNEVSAEFKRGEEQKAEQAMEVLKAIGIFAENTKNVHPQTLKAFVREMVEKGVNLPFDLFNVYVGRKAKIEGAKQ